jgi:hypothetical protein
MDTLNWIGSIVLENDTISLDISQAVVKIEITEDIFSPYVMGELVFQEMPSNNIISSFKPDGLIGKGENLKLSFITKIGNYLQELDGYHVYKVEPVAPDDALYVRQKMIYRVFFCSQIMFTNELIRINRYYEGKFSEIVKQIAKNQLQITLETVESTDKKQAIHFPRLTPIEAINMCASRSTSSENEHESNYVFYGDIDHKYHFVTLGKLMKSKPIVGTNDLDGITVTTPFGMNYTEEGNIDQGPTKYFAMRYQIKSIAPLMNLVNGMYSASMIEFDVLKRKYKKIIYNYSDEFPKCRHLVDKPILSKGADFISLSYINPDCVPFYNSSAQWLQNENESALLPFSVVNATKEYYLRHRSQMQQINQMGLEIELPGNPLIKIGQTIYFGRPQLDFSGKDADTNKRNPFVNGKFLITRKTSKIENSKSENTLGFTLSTVFSLRKDSDVGVDNIGSEPDSSTPPLLAKPKD